MSVPNQTAVSVEEKSSASVFLWKAAVSTIDFHPAITANLLLRCKRALNDTKVGVKFRKINVMSASSLQLFQHLFLQENQNQSKRSHLKK
ncbi:hypothetical protein OUZ56_001452 [Daphnia magna]|uniref:Uncharacterized protein n=1 Tax=Daphnia magna TaxID=35525 RepID=A0ABR0A2P5_9CRUS|nr:hypothetical protein OUZ56_001452 [Daphnia magna]